MRSHQQPPEPVREEDQVEDARQVLPTPEDDRPAAEWAARADRAIEARQLGTKLRKGKRVLFPTKRSLGSR